MKIDLQNLLKTSKLATPYLTFLNTRNNKHVHIIIHLQTIDLNKMFSYKIRKTKHLTTDTRRRRTGTLNKIKQIKLQKKIYIYYKKKNLSREKIQTQYEYTTTSLSHSRLKIKLKANINE